MQVLRSETVRARMEPRLKANVEGIFNTLGMNSSQAIVLFYKQVELHGGLPFELVVPRRHPLDMSAMTTAQFDAELAKGYDSAKAGRSRSVATAREDFVREFAR